MTKSLLTAAILLACSAFASAGNRQATASLEDLATASGLSTRDVQMLLGARTPHPQYLTSYERKKQQFVRAIGEEDFAELVKAYAEDRITQRNSQSG